MTTTAFLQDTLKLTAHPLQRAGAYAIATLAKVSTPETITGEQFRAVVKRMIDDLITTSTVAKGQPGWYLLGVSYVLWPNCALHYKSKRTPEGINAWRVCPPAEKWPGVPCTLCGRPAAAWYGKGDIPLGASIEHRNTTAPDHEGTPCASRASPASTPCPTPAPPVVDSSTASIPGTKSSWPASLEARSATTFRA